MKFLVLFLVLNLITTELFLRSTAATRRTQEISKFRAIYCKANNRSLILKHCYVKSYSRTDTVVNILIHLPQKVYKPVYVQFIASFQFGINFREIMNTQKQEWCDIVDGDSTNFFMKAVLDMVRHQPGVHNVFQKCPLEGDMEISNVTADTRELYKALPSGNVRFEMYIFKDDEKVFSLRLNQEIKKDPLTN